MGATGYPARAVAPMALTDKAIRAARHGDKAVRFFDGGGLYLELAPNGPEAKDAKEMLQALK